MRARVRSIRPNPRVGDVDQLAWSGPTVGPLPASLHELGIDHVTRIVDALTQAGIDAFLVDRRDDGFVIGMDAADRTQAWRALAQLADAASWQVTVVRGRRHRHVRLGRSSRDRRIAGRSTEWIVGRLYELGCRRLGESAALVITFWTVGPSGMMERLGERANEWFEADNPVTVERVGLATIPGRATFPIDLGVDYFAEPIDLVYTWVDGGDAVWRADMERWSDRSGRSADPVGRHASRYTSRNELRYSLRSVWVYAGWIRNIYIVTSGQVPPWLVQDERIRVVDHASIMPAANLPTFNSHAIEASLHHISGLSEHFLYLNDDVFLGRSLRPEDFVTPNGLAKVFLSRARVPTSSPVDAPSVDRAASLGRALVQEMSGRIVSRKPAHAPFVLLRSHLVSLEERFATAFEETRSHRFRNPDDLSVPSAFAQHAALVERRAVEGTLEVDYVAVEGSRLRWYLDRLMWSDAFDCFCLNETGAKPGVPAVNERLLERFLEERFPVAAPWEADA